MKKKSVFVLLFLFVFVLSGCSKTMDGYYHDLDKARSSVKSIYDQYSHLFSVEYEGGMIDFVVQGNTIHIVEFSVRNGTEFFPKANASYQISAHLNSSRSETRYAWSQSTAFAPMPYRWCIVDKAFNEQQDSIKAFEFSYNNNLVHLCYEIITE